MLSAYEKRLAFNWLGNMMARARRRRAVASDLMSWLDDHQAALGLGARDWPASGYLETLSDKLRGRRTVLPVEWARVARVVRARRSTHARARLDRTARRLRALGRAVGISQMDVAILELLIRRPGQPLFDSLVDVLDGSYRDRVKCGVLPTILGVSERAVGSRLTAQAPLVKFGLVVVRDDGDVEPIERLQRLVHSPVLGAEGDVRGMLLDEAQPSELGWADFDHVAELRDHAEKVLRGALAGGEPGVHILVYGPPGTGKTEFCKVLANRVEATLYQAGEADENGDEPSRRERLQELRLAQRLVGGVAKQSSRPGRSASAASAMVLFDEMEDLLGESFGGSLAALFGGGRRRARGASKVYLNRLLEEAPTPTLWTTNGAAHTCPTILRRMMVAIELRQPPPKTRARVWRRHLREHGIPASPRDARMLATDFDISPAVAAGATKAARLAGGDLDAVRVGVRSLAQLLNGDKPPQKPPPKFDLGMMNADADIEALAERLVASGERRFSLCLQGPPGSGKSAFARHLGERLGLEVVLKRASDLLSPWVGGTEALIRGAFQEAKDAQALLVFDEADSLLGDRRFAERSWEVSQVNEMLTWMESHPLPFACTTNFGERLDVATLRRFTFKITLGHLRAEQAARAFRGYFEAAPPEGLSRLAVLTPADFAVVRRRAEVLGCLNDTEALMRMLGEECAAKPGMAGKLGF